MATERITISAPNMKTVQVRIKGTAPLMINKFSNKQKQMMLDKQTQGSKAAKGKAREAKVIDDVFEAARYKSDEGWDGINAACFRNAMISACRLVGFKMTMAKMSVFIVADGYDAEEGTPLVRILGKEPEVTSMAARNATGVIDVRIRPMWREWECELRIRYDADQFSATDVMNLLMRAGDQVGVGEGRHDSKASAGMGFGSFRLIEENESVKPLPKRKVA
jgi:hypothetical protein